MTRAEKFTKILLINKNILTIARIKSEKIKYRYNAGLLIGLKNESMFYKIDPHLYRYNENYCYIYYFIPQAYFNILKIMDLKYDRRNLKEMELPSDLVEIIDADITKRLLTDEYNNL